MDNRAGGKPNKPGSGGKGKPGGRGKDKDESVNRDKRIRNVLLVILVVMSIVLGSGNKSKGPNLDGIGVVNDKEESHDVGDVVDDDVRLDPGGVESKDVTDEVEGSDVETEDDTGGVDDIEYRPIREGEEPPSDELGVEVVYIDVGQADSTLIITPNKHAVLIDGGVKKSYEAISRELDAYGVGKIDLMIATHPHADHIGALEEVLKNYDVGEIMMSSYVATTKTFENLLLEIDRQGKKITIPKIGEVRNIDGLDIEILGVDLIPNDNNSSSIVSRIEYAGNSVLFTGDLESDGEAKLVNDPDVVSRLSSDIYHVGHHGSNTSSSVIFLEKVDPSISIISVGEGNKYNHPNQEVVESLEGYSDVYRTDRDGTVRTFLSPEGIWLDYDNRE